MGITNYFIYKSPNFDFNKFSSYKKEIIYIKKPLKDDKKEEYIPCLFIIEYNLSPNFLIYFHGNSEHIFSNELFGFHLAKEFHINLILVEYKGYSIYKGEPDSKTILDDSLIVYDFIKDNFDSKEKKIIACGRSLGSSPAIYLASKRPVDALITISAFESIQKVGANFLAGFLFSSDTFESIAYISEVSCPTLFIHGKKDSLISYTQSEHLYEKCKTEKNKKDLIIRPEMSHNKSDFQDDIVSPIKDFFNKINILSQTKNTIDIESKEFLKLFEIPEYIQKFIDEKMFQISEFKKINNVEIPCTADTVIISISNEIFIFSSKNKIFIYRDGEEFKIIEEKEEENIIYLYHINDNKFLYLTNKCNLKVYTVDIYNCNLVLTVKLNNHPRKIIASEEKNIFYSLGDNLFIFKMNENEIKEIETLVNVKGNNINNFCDILAIKNNVILISEEKKILLLIDYNNYKNEIIDISNISPKKKNSLFKLNEEYFIIIENTKINIFNSNNIQFKDSIILKDFLLLNIINEEKILISEDRTKHKIIQINLIQKRKMDELLISTSPDEIEQVILMKNKKYCIIKYMNGSIISSTNKKYKIEFGA